MSYNVTVNGNTTTVSSFAAATAAVKTAAAATAAALSSPVRAGLYRSPKTTARINADRVRSAAKLAGGVKLPKKAEDVSGNVGGFAFAIARK